MHNTTLKHRDIEQFPTLMIWWAYEVLECLFGAGWGIEVVGKSGLTSLAQLGADLGLLAEGLHAAPLRPVMLGR